MPLNSNYSQPLADNEPARALWQDPVLESLLDEVIGIRAKLLTSEPIVFPGGLSDQMIAEANKMFRQSFATPRARKRKASYQQQRRDRAKQGKKVASP